MGERKKRSLTIKSEIFLISFAFLTIVSAGFTMIAMGILYKNSMDSARNSLLECNRHIVAYTEGIFHESAIMAEMLSQDVTIVNGDDGDRAAILSIYDKLLKDNQNITYVYSGYQNGMMYIGNENATENIDPVTRPWYQAALSADGVARALYLDFDTGEWFVSHSKKLVDSNGDITGVVSIDCSNKTISRQLSAKYQYNSQRSYILNPEGMALIHPEEKYINCSLLDYIDAETWDAVVSGTSNYSEYEKDGMDAMVYFERIPESDFIVATAIDAKEVVRPIIRSIEYLSVAMVIMSVILGLMLSRLLQHRFAKPIIALKSRIEKVAGGMPEEVEELSFSNAEIKGIANGIEIIVKDIAKQEKKRKAAEYLSFHDSMTGLYNRRFLENEQKRLDAERYYPLCMIVCDVNGLKLTNDIFGHDVGDQLICRVAGCLKGACRSTDVVARIGGDEFCMLLPNTPLVMAQTVLMGIKESFRRESICGVEVSASLGYGMKQKKEESMEEIIRQADNMMYGWKVIESTEMKNKTVKNIIREAAREGLVAPLKEQEEYALERLASLLCPDSRDLLKQSYQLRKVGLCTLFQFNNLSDDTLRRRYTESGYRILSAADEYRGLAGYILHYTEHWDGSGWPAGLAGRDIPFLSRIIAVLDAYFSAENSDEIREHSGWYDPEITSELLDILNDETLPKRKCLSENREEGFGGQIL